MPRKIKTLNKNCNIIEIEVPTSLELILNMDIDHIFDNYPHQTIKHAKLEYQEIMNSFSLSKKENYILKDIILVMYQDLKYVVENGSSDIRKQNLKQLEEKYPMYLYINEE